MKSEVEVGSKNYNYKGSI